jgi:pimeloyl-ACP methyl ester carboxylesterase
MPFAERDGTRLYWEESGSGDPVLLIMGLGMNATGWWRTIPVLADAGHRVLTLDNRGAGRSDKPAGPYSVAMLADDAAAILDAAGEDRAHVYGISLGGMVAQEIALRHPDRVRALVLGATTPGGTRATAPDEPALAFFARAAAMGHEETAWASVPFIYAERTRRRHADRIAEDIARRVRFPVDPRAYGHQVAAAVAHSTSARLRHIAAPTLVVHGEEDAVVPSGNARVLADAIPGAELRLLPRAGHLYVTDEPRADRDVARFLLENTPSSLRRGVAKARVRVPGAAPGAGRVLRAAWTRLRLRVRSVRLPVPARRPR